jgi:hypothetical protein
MRSLLFVLAFGVPCLAVPQERDLTWPDIAIRRVDLLWAGEYEGTVSPIPNVLPTRITNTIRGKRGVHFGIYFNIVSNLQRGVLTVTYKTSVPAPGLPGVLDDTLQRVLVDHPQCVVGKPCLVGFVFGSEEEILAGKWVLEVSFRDQKLIEHEFLVTKESDA